MTKEKTTDLKKIFSNFKVDKANYNFTLIKKGNINNTYCISIGTNKKYILQKINSNVFPDPEKLIGNIEKVTKEYKRKLQKENAFLEEGVGLVESHQEKLFFKSKLGEYWRCYNFINGRVYNHIKEDKKGIRLGFEGGKMFGKFQKRLKDLSLSELNIIIPNFQCTLTKYNEFITALENNIKNRAKFCKKEIDFFLSKEYLKKEYEKTVKNLPIRITHNDTKINNIVFSSQEKAKSVIDLDTVMPGYVVYDIGDLLRSSTCLANEDEKKLSKIKFSKKLYQEILKGYLSFTKDFLTKEEIDSLPYSINLITYNLGMRFLTDYLNGDCYFAIDPKRKNHNLDRARTQKKLLEEIEKNQQKLIKICDNLNY